MRSLARPGLLIASALLVLLAAHPARAQADGRAPADDGTWLNLGVGVTTFQSTDSAGHGDNFGVGIAWRVGRLKTGWSPSVGFSWYQTGLRTPVAGSPTRVGSIHVRPIMAGYGYTRRRGRAALSVKAMGGYAFDSISVSDTLRQAYLQAFNTWVAGNVHNSWVVMPQATVWYDVAPRVSMNVSLGYLVNRPTVLLTTPAGQTSQRWNADMVTLTVGVVYGIF